MFSNAPKCRILIRAKKRVIIKALNNNTYKLLVSGDVQCGRKIAQSHEHVCT